MAKTHIGKSKPQQGSVPACTGAKLEVVSVEPGKTGPNAKTPGLKRYTITFKVKEPKVFKGSQVRCWPTVGTEDDPRAKKEETWDRTEGGPGQLARLFDKTGVERPEDDEEWDGALSGAEVIAPITARPMDDGSIMNGVGLFFNESDDDVPEIGVDEGGGKGRGAAAGGKKARGRKVEPDDDDADDDDKPKKKGKESDDDDDKDEDDDKPKRGRPAGSKNKKPKDDDGDDD